MNYGLDDRGLPKSKTQSYAWLKENYPDLTGWIAGTTTYLCAEALCEIFDYGDRVDVNLYSALHVYHINADKIGNYLGLTFSLRATGAGNDKADGPYTKDTWERIVRDMWSCELIPLDERNESQRDAKQSDRPQDLRDLWLSRKFVDEVFARDSAPVLTVRDRLVLGFILFINCLSANIRDKSLSPRWLTFMRKFLSAKCFEYVTRSLRLYDDLGNVGRFGPLVRMSALRNTLFYQSTLKSIRESADMYDLRQERKNSLVESQKRASGL